ncbi:mCG145283, partial [Mus musculus]
GSWLATLYLPGLSAQGGATQSGQGLTHQSSIKKKPHTSQSDGDICSVEVPSSEMTPTCAKLTESKEYREKVLQVELLKDSCIVKHGRLFTS